MENYELVANIVEAKSYGLVKMLNLLKNGRRDRSTS
jgi:hypothetical protein